MSTVLNKPSTTVAASPNSNRNANAPASKVRGGKSRSNSKFGAPKKPPEIVKTWAFDSVGDRKYALQIRKASNGNPCLKIVEGVPQPDGTYRRFELTIWSEDWPRLFATLDEARAFINEKNIRTPEGHKYDPRKKTAKKRA